MSHEHRCPVEQNVSKHIMRSI